MWAYYTGSPWAFSTIGAVEGIIRIVTGELISLSEELVARDKSYNLGCNGDLMHCAFDFIIANGGMTPKLTIPTMELKAFATPRGFVLFSWYILVNNLL